MIVIVAVALPAFSAAPAFLGAAAAAAGGVEEIVAAAAAGGTEASWFLMMLLSLVLYCTVDRRKVPCVSRAAVVFLSQYFLYATFLLSVHFTLAGLAQNYFCIQTNKISFIPFIALVSNVVKLPIFIFASNTSSYHRLEPPNWSSTSYCLRFSASLSVSCASFIRRKMSAASSLGFLSG